MTDQRDIEPTIAVFCDYENVAIGARDARYDGFEIELCLERLLDKGKVVLKKAYCDWDRYKSSKRELHEAAFELIEIPHVSYSGKNSADIRLVVDALDLCYTKAHVDMFAIISGDSDFSPLVSKLRENNKRVIGMGVKSSSSDLLIENCDEFIYYDDLVRGKPRPKRPRKNNSRGKGRGGSAPAAGNSSSASSSTSSPSSSTGTGNTATANAGSGNGAPQEKGSATPSPSSSAEKAPASAVVSDEETEKRQKQAIDYVLDIVESLFRDRDDYVWGSMIKQTLKRKRPSFSESYHGYRSFSELLEDAEERGLLELSKDERSGGYQVLGFGPNA